MQDILVKIGSNASAARDSLAEILKQSSRLDFDADFMRASAGIMLNDLLTRTEAILSLAQPLAETPVEKLILVPSANLGSLAKSLAGINGTLAAIKQNFAHFIEWGGIQRADGNGVIFASNNQQFALRATLDQLLAHQDTTLSNYAVIGIAVKPRAVGTFSAAAKGLQETLKAFGAALEDANTKLADVEGKLLRVSATEEVTATDQSETKRLREESEKDRKTIEEYRSEATAAKATIDEVRTEAATLKAAVREYQAQFEAFQTALDQREKALQEGNKKLNVLTKDLAEQQTAITNLTEKAEEMLGGATNAGLSTAYQKTTKSVDGQLSWARASYYLSLVLLSLSVLIALNLTDLGGRLNGLPPLPTITVDTAVGAVALQLLAGLGARALIILPALLFAGFAAHRHSTLFRLREEYSHKYTMAASVHGFKLQAPSYEEPIAAAVFQELLDNPTTSMDEKKVKKENGFVARIIGPQVEAALKRMEAID